MASGKPKKRKAPFKQATLPRIKLFRAMSWYEGYSTTSCGDYVSHILTELGRLGLEMRDVEDYSRPPNTQSVLSDILDWFADHPGKAFSNLVDWRTLDLAHIRTRLEKDRTARPRIELTAHITKMNNLSVRWHPGGWRRSIVNWESTGRNEINVITHRKWPSPPDFRWFMGDESPTFDSRPTNELMYIRGVGKLRCQPENVPGPYATHNSDVLHSLMICAVRAAYEGLVIQLERIFEVDVVDEFDFHIRDEVDDEHRIPLTVRRVVSWSLENAAELRARKEEEAAAERARQDRMQFDHLERTYGFGWQTFIECLLEASRPSARGRIPTREQISQAAAKELRSRGHSLDAGNVRYLRGLVEQFSSELLPESLQPEPADPISLAPGNVVHLRKP